MGNINYSIVPPVELLLTRAYISTEMSIQFKKKKYSYTRHDILLYIPQVMLSNHVIILYFGTPIVYYNYCKRN